MKTTVRTMLFALVLGVAPQGLVAQAQYQLPRDEAGPMTWHPEAEEAIDQLKSPYCPGFMLEVCSSSGGAALRDSIQQLALQGQSSEELIDWVLANHGEQWRALPERSGMSLILAWMVPPFGVLLGLALVVVALRKMRSDSPRVAVAEGPISAKDEARLREALRELDVEEEATFF